MPAPLVLNRGRAKVSGARHLLEKGHRLDKFVVQMPRPYQSLCDEKRAHGKI